jgi:hypothetical protein
MCNVFTLTFFSPHSSGDYSCIKQRYLISIHDGVILLPLTLDPRPQIYPMAVPIQQAPPVTSFSSFFRPVTRLTSVVSDRVCICG